MGQLREVLTAAGFRNVRTYIQSGNALVDTNLSAREIEQYVHDLIKKQIGPDLVVIVRTPEELQATLASNPFQEGYDISRIFFVLLAHTPVAEKVQKLLSQDFGEEQLAIIGDTTYLSIPGVYGRKLSNNFVEKQLNVSATTRNFNTLSKLVQMSKK